jgi:hypothetical protein
VFESQSRRTNKVSFGKSSRYGKPGCNAETCDYFLSYRMIGADVEFELSADTDGWVAVGFSSDKKMVRRKS